MVGCQGGLTDMPANLLLAPTISGRPFRVYKQTRYIKLPNDISCALIVKERMSDDLSDLRLR